MKRPVTRNRRHARPNVLEVRVVSPRIVWLGCLRLAGKVLKLALGLALLGGAAWGIWRGIQHALYQNPDFHLRRIALNPNTVIDETGVLNTAGIDLSASPSLFDLDVRDIERRLLSLPEIAEATVERHLPGTLAVNVTPRFPRAWISAKGLPPPRKPGAMLVDNQGVAYPCPARLAEASAGLPVIILPAAKQHPIQAGKPVQLAELHQCFKLLDEARAADPEALQWIDSVRQATAWSLVLVTRDGTEATFGLGDHPRQMENLRGALNHAAKNGYTIATINLIPKYNIPVTVRGETPKPPRAVPVANPSPPNQSSLATRHSGGTATRARPAAGPGTAAAKPARSGSSTRSATPVAARNTRGAAPKAVPVADIPRAVPVNVPPDKTPGSRRERDTRNLLKRY